MRSVGNSMRNEKHREKWRKHSHHYSSSQRASHENEILHPRNVAVTAILFLNFFGGSFLTYLIQLKHFQKANQMGKAQGYRTGSQGAPAWTGWQIGRFHCTEISTLRTPPKHTCKDSLYTSPSHSLTQKVILKMARILNQHFAKVPLPQAVPLFLLLANRRSKRTAQPACRCSPDQLGKSHRLEERSVSLPWQEDAHNRDWRLCLGISYMTCSTTRC